MRLGQKEIFAVDDIDPEINNTVFGYQERYGEYRYKQNMITAEMRSNHGPSGDGTSTLDSWHLAQDFASAPVLGDAFIRDNPPVERVLAVTSEIQFILDFWFNLKHTRPMATRGIPGMIDHF